ncbi:hypothetical protein L2E82_36135 [Cichorium intybus]|uniref:Uncharacterized protein n=1 Tax=Cichorium intybus TaxID=13427 RepID=A0ACB9BQQ0_CICIN|nr:hypothetical protein L2E82_36135 [Cichorium intybus]
MNVLQVCVSELPSSVINPVSSSSHRLTKHRHNTTTDDISLPSPTPSVTPFLGDPITGENRADLTNKWE